MARWLVAYCCPEEGGAETRDAARQTVCLRVFPEGEPERWIVQTNPALPPDVQEEMALLIADALFNLLGI
jgi:hypothetical protein